MIESRTADFGNEDRFSSVPRLKDMPYSLKTSVVTEFGNNSASTKDVPSTSTEPRKGTRVRKAKSFGSDFHLYLVEGTMNGVEHRVEHQYQYCFNIEEDPKTYSQAMASRDVAF